VQHKRKGALCPTKKALFSLSVHSTPTRSSTSKTRLPSPHTSRFTCGVGHPAYEFLKEAEGPHARVTQDYRGEPPAGVATARGLLTAQTYGGSTTTFMTANKANATGKSRPIRITPIWTAVENGDNLASSGCTATANPLQCSSATQTVSVKSMTGTTYTDYSCATKKDGWTTEQMVITPADRADGHYSCPPRCDETTHG
jgi:hypothetical protein